MTAYVRTDPGSPQCRRASPALTSACRAGATEFADVASAKASSVAVTGCGPTFSSARKIRRSTGRPPRPFECHMSLYPRCSRSLNAAPTRKRHTANDPSGQLILRAGRLGAPRRDRAFPARGTATVSEHRAIGGRSKRSDRSPLPHPRSASAAAPQRRGRRAFAPMRSSIYSRHSRRTTISRSRRAISNHANSVVGFARAGHRVRKKKTRRYQRV